MNNKLLFLYIIVFLYTGCKKTVSNGNENKLDTTVKNIEVPKIEIPDYKYMSIDMNEIKHTFNLDSLPQGMKTKVIQIFVWPKDIPYIEEDWDKDYTEQERKDMDIMYQHEQDKYFSILSIISPYFQSEVYKMKGFKPIGNIEFRQKIESIFNLNLEQPSSNIDEYETFYLYKIGGFHSATGLFKTHSDNHYDNLGEINQKNYHLMLSKTHNIIYGLRYFYSSAFGFDESTLHLNLRVDPYIYHLNQYLLNDNKASLTWLLASSNEYFLEEPHILEWLNIGGGFDKEDKINRLVLERILKRYSTIKDVTPLLSVFVQIPYSEPIDLRKNIPEASVRLKEGMLKTVSNMYNHQEHKGILDMLNFYYENGLTEDDNHFKNTGSAELIKIKTYIGYYLEKGYLNNPSIKRESNDNYFKAALLADEDLYHEIVSNNYYHLDGFEEMFKKELEAH